MSVGGHLITTCWEMCRPIQKPERKRLETGAQSVEQQAIVISDFIHKRQVLGQKEPPPDRVCETISFLVDEFLRGNSKTMSAITDVLDETVRDGKTDEQVITRIFDSMFSDGKITWGRIAATYAFGVKYSQDCTSADINGNNKIKQDDKVLRFVGHYVGEKLGTWIKKEGGWNAVVALFPRKDIVVKQLRSAGYLILTVGIGSLFTVLTS